MNIYMKLAKMSDKQLDACWRALADYDPSWDSQWYDQEGGITMDDWMQAVYSEMDHRGMPHMNSADIAAEKAAYDAEIRY